MDHRLSNAYHRDDKQHQIDTIHRLAYGTIYKVKCNFCERAFFHQYIFPESQKDRFVFYKSFCTRRFSAVWAIRAQK
jgi:hypothetical protein